MKVRTEPSNFPFQACAGEIQVPSPGSPQSFALVVERMRRWQPSGLSVVFPVLQVLVMVGHSLKTFFKCKFSFQMLFANCCWYLIMANFKLCRQPLIHIIQRHFQNSTLNILCGPLTNRGSSQLAQKSHCKYFHKSKDEQNDPTANSIHYIDFHPCLIWRALFVFLNSLLNPKWNYDQAYLDHHRFKKNML